MNAQNPRVVIADDAALLREGVRHVLEAGGCQVVASVGTVAELDAVLAGDSTIDAVVLDIRMPPDHADEGMVALESLRARGSSVGVLLLSMYASPTLAMRAMSAGSATGYLLKERVAHGDALVAAVRTIVSGGTVVDPAIVAMLVSSTSRATMLDRLTQREREVLRLMAEGSSNLGIADHLHVSVKTVETHVAHVFEKLGIEPSPTEHRRVLAVLEFLRSSA